MKTSYKSMQDAPTAMFRELSIVLNVYIRHKETFNNIDLRFYHRNLKTKIKSKVNQKKETLISE